MCKCRCLFHVRQCDVNGNYSNLKDIYIYIDIFASTHSIVIASNAEFVNQHAFIFPGHDQPIIEDTFDLLGTRWMDSDGPDPMLDRSLREKPVSDYWNRFGLKFSFQTVSTNQGRAASG